MRKREKAKKRRKSSFFVSHLCKKKKKKKKTVHQLFEKRAYTGGRGIAQKKVQACFMWGSENEKKRRGSARQQGNKSSRKLS